MNIFIQSLLDEKMKGCKIIPINFCETRKYEINLIGWKPNYICELDGDFSKSFELIHYFLGKFIEIYKDKFAFTDPQFFWKPTGEFGLRIGTMDLEQYNDLISMENK